MRYEGTRFPVPHEAPDFFKKFLDHYSLVIKFLTSFNENRFNFRDDIKSQVTTREIYHGIPNRIAHSLGYVPAMVYVVSGRVEVLNTVTRSDKETVVIPKLLSTPLIDPPLGRVTQEVTLANPSLFRERDYVLLGDQERQIRSIRGNTATLDQSLLCGKVYSLSLARETVQLIII